MSTGKKKIVGNFCFFLTLFIFVSAVNILFGEEMEMKPFSFKLSEHPQAKFTLREKNAPVKIITNGFIQDPENPGGKIYKLEILLTNSSYVIFRTPCRVPVFDKLKSSFRCKVVASGRRNILDSCQIGFLADFIPGYSGYVITKRIGLNDGWNTLKIDNIFENCAYGARLVAQRRYKGVNAENLTPYLSTICLYLNGHTGAKFAIYIRDIEISGETVSKRDMRKIVARRWAPAKEKTEQRIKALQKQLESVSKELATAKLPSASGRSWKIRLTEKLNACSGQLANALKRGFIRREAEEQLTAEVNGLAGFDIKGLDKYLQNENNADYLPFVVAPISDRRILPESTVFGGRFGTEIKMTATPGEFEPAGFVISALKPLNKVIAMPSGLKNPENGATIPAAAVDIKLVKCWYQAGTAWVATYQKRDQKVMVPELLLNDDSLVKVDTGKKENYLRLAFPNGEKYVWISNPKEKTDGVYKILENKDFPVKDSSRLLPVDIPGGKNQQFWVTVKVPVDAAPGLYRGKIDLTQAGRPIGKLSLSLKVLPFKLLPPYYTSSIFYRAQLSVKYPEGTISAEYKSEKQLEAELKNMAEHGVSNPICYQLFKNRELLKKYLSLRKLAGMDSRDFYYCYGINVGCDDSLKGREALGNRVKTVLAFLKNYGIDEVYFFARDEAKGKRLKIQRRFWDCVHKAGGKVFATGTTKNNFAAMGDIQDLLVSASNLNKEDAAKWHSKGHSIWSYANPQAGVENPVVYRRNYGILLWQNNYDGAATFAYQSSFGNSWNDFDGSLRDLIFTYPTVDGVINTIAWEGYREGVDDVRYLTTLLNDLEKAKKENKPEKQKIVLKAEKYLRNLKKTDIMKLDLDDMRLRIAGYITELQK